MSVTRRVSEIIDEHVTIEGIDRMYLDVYIPRLQSPEGVAAFFRFHRGHKYASSPLMDPISKGFISSIEDLAAAEQIPLITFRKGERKDDIAAEMRSLRCSEPRSGPTHDRVQVSVDRPRDGDGEPVLLLPDRPGLRSAVHQIRFVLSVHGQALHQRPRVAQTATQTARPHP